MSLGNGLTITRQSIGVASRSQGFDGVDGILGIGPVDLTVGTLSPDTRSTIPTVTDNLFSQGTISANEIGISFEPTDGIDVTNGELSFGGIDESKFTGPLNFVYVISDMTFPITEVKERPITTTLPAASFVGIDQSVTYGAANIPILNTSAGITDTGTTLLLLATGLS